MADEEQDPGTAPRRVLHVVGTLDRGGAESWLLALFRRADRRVLAMDFCVLSGRRGACAEAIEAGGGTIHLCPLRPYRGFRKRFGDLLDRGGYNVVHSHVWLFSGQILRIAEGRGVPVRIAYCHSTREVRPRPWAILRHLYAHHMRGLIARHATHRLACSAAAAQALFGQDWRTRQGCGLLYCSIDAEDFRPRSPASVSRRELSLPDDAVVVGHVGNLREPKNHAFLLEIAAEVLKLEPRAYFYCAGEGPLRRGLEEKARRLGIAGRVIFAGLRNDVPQLLMHVFDAFLFPSLWEGLPLAAVEAAAAGLRVVYSDRITPEVEQALPEAFTRVSLDAPASRWAEAVLKAVRQGRLPAEHAYKAVRESCFSVERSLGELGGIYGCSRSPVLGA